jgi:hypothetical protein
MLAKPLSQIRRVADVKPIITSRAQQVNVEHVASLVVRCTHNPVPSSWHVSEAFYVPVTRQVREKLRHLHFRHVARMAFLMKQDEASDPVDITLLGAEGIMLALDDVSMGEAIYPNRFSPSTRIGRIMPKGVAA